MKSLIFALLCAATTIAVAGPADPKGPAPTAAAGKAQLTWYGHAAFRIDTPAGKSILIDPWISNPSNPTGKDDAKSVKADLILISHGHFDHIGDAVDIGKRTKAKLVATFDLGNALVGTMGYPKDQYGFDTGGNFGGSVTALDGEVTITFIPAVHSSAIGTDPAKAGYGGEPGGFVIAIKNGPTLYHTGDTDLFGDMANVGKFFKVDYMLSCIGDHFTMGPARAAEATKLVKAKTVIPMHFGTFPVLTGTVADFGKALKAAGASSKLVEMKIGQTLPL